MDRRMDDLEKTVAAQLNGKNGKKPGDEGMLLGTDGDRPTTE